MKRLINPTRRQKTFLAEHGLKAENWKIEKETPEYAAEMAYRMVVSSVTAFYDTKEGREDN